MTIENIILNLKREVIRTFAMADEWFDRSDQLHQFKPSSGGWCIAEVLEHITLTNHYLLLIIEKGQQKALNKVAEGHRMEEQLKNYTLALPGLVEIGEHKSFAWHRPDHHQPSGEKSIDELRFLLRDQLCRCLYVLENIPGGQGILHQTTMSVNNLGKLDMYQYLYFLSLHVKRHLTQMTKVEYEYNAAGVAEANPM